MLELALETECPPLDLTAMRPAASAFVYEFRDADGNPDGDRDRNEFEILDGGAVSVTRVTERGGQRRADTFNTTVRYGFFAELPDWPEQGLRWSYQYDSDAIQELESLEPGETVEIPAVSVMNYRGGRNRVEDVHRVTHQGCTEVEIMDARVLVHTLRFDVFNQFVRGGEPRTRRSILVREFAPSYGWWVAERHPTLGSMVVVEVEN